MSWVEITCLALFSNFRDPGRKLELNTEFYTFFWLLYKNVDIDECNASLIISKLDIGNLLIIHNLIFQKVYLLFYIENDTF